VGSFHIPRGASRRCCPCSDDVAHCPFKLHAEKLELTPGYGEPLRVAHHPALPIERAFPAQWPNRERRRIGRFHQVRVEQATAAFDVIPDRIDECRRCEQAAGRAVSVPLGFGANTSGPRNTLVATIRATDTALAEAGVGRGSEEETRHNKRRAIHSR
jgi:hypothetical protein